MVKNSLKYVFLMASLSLVGTNTVAFEGKGAMPLVEQASVQVSLGLFNLASIYSFLNDNPNINLTHLMSVYGVLSLGANYALHDQKKSLPFRALDYASGALAVATIALAGYRYYHAYYESKYQKIDNALYELKCLYEKSHETIKANVKSLRIFYKDIALCKCQLSDVEKCDHIVLREQLITTQHLFDEIDESLKKIEHCVRDAEQYVEQLNKLKRASSKIANWCASDLEKIQERKTRMVEAAHLVHEVENLRLYGKEPYHIEVLGHIQEIEKESDAGNFLKALISPWVGILFGREAFDSWVTPRKNRLWYQVRLRSKV